MKKEYLVKLIYEFNGIEENGILTFNSYEEADKTFNKTVATTLKLMESKSLSSYNPYKKIILYEGTNVVKRWINKDEYKRFKHKKYY